MKIGIVTLPLGWNYGGILQNWALHESLKAMGHTPVNIRAVAPASRLLEVYAIVRDGFIKHDWNRWRFGCLNRTILCRKPDADNGGIDFKSLGIEQTDLLHTKRRIRRAARAFDAFVVGSDQVWRQEYSANIQAHFLNFVPASNKRKRIAYAASFGKEKDYISNRNMPSSRKLLRQFDAVSVREYSGLNILKSDFGVSNAAKVLDPTLLIGKGRYLNLCKEIPCSSEPYTLNYILDANEEKESVASEVITALGNKRLDFVGNDVYRAAPSIAKWLAAFRDAQFVFTDSFHGCVFSIIFNKPFVAFANKHRGLDRFVSLLRDFDLEDRLVFSHQEYMERKDALQAPVAWEKVNHTLQNLRKYSLSWLQNAVSQ